MTSIFYPVLPFTCPWQCTFCGIPSMEKVITTDMPSDEQLRKQFNEFLTYGRNKQDIERHRRIAIAPNGSIVPEVPRTLREYVLNHCQDNALRFESECIATLINKEKARTIYERYYGRRFPDLSLEERQQKVIHTINDIETALNKDFPGKNVLLNAGLEVANEHDLARLHKYTTRLEDFITYADYLREREIKVGANILVGAPGIEDPITKAFETVRFAFEEMRADKILLITWNPVNHTAAKKLYDLGKIDVISATEAAEIYQQTKERYREKNIEFNNMRTYVFHGKHPTFRKTRISTEEQKEQTRQKVRTIARKILH